MNYIYDITVNFNEIFYDFFEWNKNDQLLHIRKIPIFKLDNNSFCKIFNNIIVLNEFDKIIKKTEIYGKKNKNINCCLFCDDNNIIAVEFDDKGLSKNISSITVEEELDILECLKLKKKELDFKIIKERKQYYQTRSERKNKSYIKNFINNLNVEDDEEKIKYLYFEYYNKFNNNPKDALNKLKKDLNSNTLNEEIKYFLRLSSKQQ